MNKYDKTILEIAHPDATIYELIRRKIQNPLTQFIDIMLSNILTATDGLKIQGAYYLLITKENATLIHLKTDLEVLQYNVTNVINTTLNKKSFEYEEQRYKLFRKVR